MSLVFRDGPEPIAGPDDAVLAVEAVGICGSDIHLYTGQHPYARFPIIQGHEFSGRVLILPRGYGGEVKVGDRVAVEPLLTCGECLPCRRGRSNCCVRMRTLGAHVDGGLSERIAVRVSSLHPANDLPADLAALAEPLSIGIHSVSRLSPAAGDKIVVFGAGPIGQAIVLALEARGAEVMVVDRLASRLRMATDLGAGRTALVDNARAAIGEWTRGEGPVAVFEATGVPAVLEEAVELVAHSGSVIVVGLSSERVSIPMVEFTRKELSVLGSRNSSGEFRAALDLLRDQRRRVEQLITHRYTFDAASAAFRQAHEHPGDTEKVIIMMEAG